MEDSVRGLLRRTRSIFIHLMCVNIGAGGGWGVSWCPPAPCVEGGGGGVI